MFGEANCTFIPDAVPSDAGIAGAGVCDALRLPLTPDARTRLILLMLFFLQVLLSSAITAGLALGISASLVSQKLHRSPRGTVNRNPSVIRRKLLNGYSDQQILVGIGLQSVGLAKSNSLVPYHFFIIWMLALLSMATHNAALLALVQDFRRDLVLRWLRQALMFVNLVLSCVYGVYVLQSKIKGLPNTLPISCVWKLESTTSNVGGLDYVATIATIAANCIVFALATWYLQSCRQRLNKTVLQITALILMLAIAIGTPPPRFVL